ncbi:3'-5' exonuclease [Nodosilinea sp. P-1105]|uniref:3'-5' exonuclease n=1 Tax=Nodosilinea sp. P-1105 TaxID=2546229 RepID=UPI00146EBCB2|nr:3'-5' exonuclease [Nodosilinea sp. P-1105]NMF83989.1 3'-5' exonuclease [Nodosilinea sp. P-1105]
MIPVSASGIAQSTLLSDHLLTYYRQLTEAQLTVVDVETTGSRARDGRVIEIAVIQGSLQAGITYETSVMVNANVSVPAMITRLTGITTAMVRQGQTAEAVWSGLQPRLNQGTLTAHNLTFDYSFIQSEYHRLGKTFQRPDRQQFCTVLLSRLLLADLPSRSLPQLVQHFGFDVGRSHRALADTKACWLLANVLLTQLGELSDSALRQQFAQQWIPLREAAKAFTCTKRELQQQLDQRGCEYRASRRSNRYLYRRGDLETLYQELYPQQLLLNL